MKEWDAPAAYINDNFYLGYFTGDDLKRWIPVISSEPISYENILDEFVGGSEDSELIS